MSELIRDDEKIEREGHIIFDASDLSLHGLDRRSYGAGYLDGYTQAREDSAPWYMRDQFGVPLDLNGQGILRRIAKIVLVNYEKLV